MAYVKHLKDIKKDDIPLVGGKGANLGEMYAKFAIPSGFCVTIHAFEEHLKQGNLKEMITDRLSKVDMEKTADVEKASEEIRKAIHESEMPKEILDEIKKHHEQVVGFVAVRSSATAEDLPTASFAGQQDTFLNVGSYDILDAVKKCWSSLYTARAIHYRVRNDFKHEDVSISVVVQQMVDAAVAGVCFTANPITNDRNGMVIEAVFGLGETLVSGSVTPDTYMLKKEPLEITEQHPGAQKFALHRDSKGGTSKEELGGKGEERKLTDRQILEVAREAMKIEEHYGTPQDIEFAFDKEGKLHILQSRPITTLK